MILILNLLVTLNTHHQHQSAFPDTYSHTTSRGTTCSLQKMRHIMAQGYMEIGTCIILFPPRANEIFEWMTCNCGFSKHFIFTYYSSTVAVVHHSKTEWFSPTCVLCHYFTILPHFKNMRIKSTVNFKMFLIMSMWVNCVSFKVDRKLVEKATCLLTLAGPIITLIGGKYSINGEPMGVIS